MPIKGICEAYGGACGRNKPSPPAPQKVEKPVVEEKFTQPDKNVIIANKFNQTAKVYAVLSDTCPHCQNFVNHANQHGLQFITVDQSQPALYKEILQAGGGGVPAFKIVSNQFPSGSVKIVGYGGSMEWLHGEVINKIGGTQEQPTSTGGSGGNHAINQTHGTLKLWISPTCPWCTKIKQLFDDNGVGYEIITNSPPPQGNGVPQVQSAKTNKVCVGYRDIDAIIAELN